MVQPTVWSRAPRRFINSTKPGKLVSMKLPSSMVIGSWLTVPNTRKLMAMRWSMAVAMAPPPRGGRPQP